MVPMFILWEKSGELTMFKLHLKGFDPLRRLSRLASNGKPCR